MAARIHIAYASDIERRLRNSTVVILGQIATTLDVPAAAFLAEVPDREEAS